MLILSRKVGEKLIITGEGISEPIEITILNVNGNQVRIGTYAPKEIGVNREEIYLRKLADKNGQS